MFLKRYATKYNKPIEGFDQAAVREMDEYPWAGNIRELQHTVEKAVIMSDGRRITPATLLLRPAPAAVQALAFSTLEEMERGMIGQAMARYAGNLTEVARQLGIKAGKVAMLGGLLEHDTKLRETFVAEMGGQYPALVCTEPEQDAAAGALMLAKEML